jgi:hypothetical protein
MANAELEAKFSAKSCGQSNSKFMAFQVQGIAILPCIKVAITPL